MGFYSDTHNFVCTLKEYKPRPKDDVIVKAQNDTETKAENYSTATLTCRFALSLYIGI